MPSSLVRTLSIAAIALATLLAARHPLESTMPVYAALAERLRSGPVTASFEPLGYAWLIAVMPFDSLESSVKALHVACFVGLVLVVHAISRRSERPLSPWMFLATAWALFNPYVLVNVYRLNDNNLNVVAILAVFALIWLRGEATRYIEWAAAGAIIGALAMARPNVISLLPVVWIAAWSPSTLRRPAWHGAIATMTMGLAYVACSLMITGVAAFRPGNGPYNLFAGNNPSTASAITAEYNAEFSLPAGLAWCGVNGAPRTIDAATYLRCSKKFVMEMPIAAVTAGALKFYNLMWRPNLRLADSAIQVAAQILQMLPSWLWWAASVMVLIRRKRLLDPIATAFIVLFALPFVLTNSDPRFRLPLDAVFAVSLASAPGIRLLRDSLAWSSPS